MQKFTQPLFQKQEPLKAKLRSQERLAFESFRRLLNKHPREALSLFKSWIQLRNEACARALKIVQAEASPTEQTLLIQSLSLTEYQTLKRLLALPLGIDLNQKGADFLSAQTKEEKSIPEIIQQNLESLTTNLRTNEDAIAESHRETDTQIALRQDGPLVRITSAPLNNKVYDLFPEVLILKLPADVLQTLLANMPSETRAYFLASLKLEERKKLFVCLGPTGSLLRDSVELAVFRLESNPYQKDWIEKDSEIYWKQFVEHVRAQLKTEPEAQKRVQSVLHSWLRDQ